MKEFYFFVVFFIMVIVMFFFGANQQRDFQKCVDTVAERYPSSKPMPPGQPFTDIYACMSEAGYIQDTQPLSCKDGDYTVIIMKQQCYRPTNFLKGYVHDLKTVFR